MVDRNSVSVSKKNIFIQWIFNPFSSGTVSVPMIRATIALLHARHALQGIAVDFLEI